MLASQGLTAPPAPFEGPHGLWDLMGTRDIGPLPRGPVPAVTRASYKYYLTEYHSQAAIMAVLALRERVDPAQVAAVRIETDRFAWTEIGSGPEKWRPATRETADHSLPYIAAAVLVDGVFSDDIFRPERFSDARILQLIDKVTVVENPAFTEVFPAEMPCRVAITDRDGRLHSAEVRHPPGHPANPLTNDQVAAKFRALTGRALHAVQAERLLDTLWRLGEKGGGLDEIFAEAAVQ